MEMASDAVRCLCCLQSNRTRLGEAGACEALARALIKVRRRALHGFCYLLLYDICGLLMMTFIRFVFFFLSFL